MKIKWDLKTILKKVNEMYEKETDYKEYICLISKKETKEMRSISQNNMFHWLFTEISNHIWIDSDEIKQNFLKWLFWVKKSQLWIFTSEVAIEPHTSKLNKIQAIKLIKWIKDFIKKYWIPCKYTSREFRNLLLTYKKNEK